MVKRLIGVFMAFCFLGVLAGPGYAEEKKDVTTFRIIGLYDLTGPYSGLHQVILKGVKDFIVWGNNEPGYLPDGVKWQHEIFDTGMDMQKCISAYQLATSKKPKPIITTGGLASPTIIAIKPLAKRKKIPCIDGSSARPIMVPPAWSFSMQGCYEGMIAASAKFLKDNWNSDTPYKLIKKRYEANKGRNPRITVMGWDNSFGRAFDQKEIKPYLKSIGVDWVEPEYVPVSPTDTTPQILRIVERGADLVFFGMYANTHAFVLKDAARVGVRDKFQDMAFWADNIIQIRTYAKEVANETMMLTGYQPVTSEWNPVFREMFEKTKMSEDYALGYSLAMSWWDVYAECIRRAVAKVGAENVTGPVIYDVLTSMTDYKCMAYNSLITFSKTKTYGPSTASIYHNQDGKIVKVVDSIYLPDLLPGGKDVIK